MGWMEDRKRYSCKNCAKYKGNWSGDCGHHYTYYNHEKEKFETNYELPSESMFDGVLGPCPSCWEPNQVLVEHKKAERITTLINNYSLEELGQAYYLKSTQEKHKELERLRDELVESISSSEGSTAEDS